MRPDAQRAGDLPARAGVELAILIRRVQGNRPARRRLRLVMPADEAVLAARRQLDAGRNLKIARQPLVERQQVEFDEIARVEIDAQELHVRAPRLEPSVEIEVVREVRFE